MGQFTERYGQLRVDTEDYIKDFLKKNGNRFEFANQEEIESDDFSEFAWQLPQATYVGKHEYTYFFAITSITLENDNVWFNGVSIGEDSEDHNFGTSEVDVACLCDSADLLTLNN